MAKETKSELTLRQKLAYIQQMLKAHKGQFNAFGKYKYRSCEDILEAVKPLLLKTGTVLIISDELCFVGEWHYVRATVTFAISEAVNEADMKTTAYAREPEVKKGMDASQITGCASSYARKYALNGLFCIDDTKDADTMDNRGEGERKPATFTPPAKKTGPATSTSVQTITAKAKEAKAKELKAKIDELIGVAYVEYQLVNAPDVPEGKTFKKEYFINEVREVYKKLDPKDKKIFEWNLTGVKWLANSVNLTNCLTRFEGKDE